MRSGCRPPDDRKAGVRATPVFRQVDRAPGMHRRAIREQPPPADGAARARCGAGLSGRPASRRGPARSSARLTKSFGGVRALDDAALRRVAGEVHALVGENGAGKSTLIKALGGRLAPDAGTIRIKGKARSRWRRRRTPTGSASGRCSRN